MLTNYTRETKLPKKKAKNLMNLKHVAASIIWRRRGCDFLKEILSFFVAQQVAQFFVHKIENEVFKLTFETQETSLTDALCYVWFHSLNVNKRSYNDFRRHNLFLPTMLFILLPKLFFEWTENFGLTGVRVGLRKNVKLTPKISENVRKIRRSINSGINW